MAEKCTLEESERRATVLTKMITEGRTRAYMMQYCADEWGLKERQSRIYLGRAIENVRKMWRMKREDFVATNLTFLDLIREKSTDEKQYSAAIGAISVAAKMVGAEQPR